MICPNCFFRMALVVTVTIVVCILLLPVASRPSSALSYGYFLDQQSRPNVLRVQAPSANSVPKAVIEQYKVYVGDLGTVGSAFATTQMFFLTVVAALIGVLGFKEKVRPVPDYFGPVPILIFIFIALVSLVWGLTAWLFDNLIGAKFAVLQAMEETYPGLYPMFKKQKDLYEAHWVYGIIRMEYPLIGLIFVGAAVIAGLGVRWQIRNRIIRY